MFKQNLVFAVLKATIRIAFLLLLPSITDINYELKAQSYPKYEMRAVWVATINNIDWPSQSTLSVPDQKMEMIRLLDLIKQNNLNTIVFQIRPSADAFYKSDIEPWSQWLTGSQGRPPDPLYDPLEFVIKECRKRGIDIHVWLNPYRAVADTANKISLQHISKIHPEWFILYGRTLYFNPAIQEIRDYLCCVVSDIVRRYDVDAIHLDDYFYPYRIADVNFPDDSSFFKFSRGFLPEKRNDWRRDNVNLIIKQLYDSIKAIKPWVEFGVSPFGVWRNSSADPSGSETEAGQTNYDDLFADILLWQKNGWIDYVVPQIYWHIGFRIADYSVLTSWWSRNTYGCKLYIGQAPYRISRRAELKKWRNANEIIRQISLNRTYPNICGSVFFSERVFRNNPSRLNQKMLRGPYRYQSVTPSNSRIVPILPQRPSGTRIEEHSDSIRLSWNSEGNTKKFIIYKIRKGRVADLNNPQNIMLITSETNVSIPLNGRTDSKRHNYYITSISRTNTESDPEYFKPAKLN